VKLVRRKVLQLAAVVTASQVLPRIAWSSEYPVRPLQWIIGFPPGGGTDVVAREMARWLSDHLGQEVVVVNKPGAATNIAAQAAINSPADGYTLLWIGTSNAINATLYKTLPFDFFKSIAPVAGICVSPMVIVAHPSVTANNIADLITLARAAPGTMTMASFGTGTISHVAGELFKTMAGVNIVHVPYRGGAPMINDLIGGHIQVAVDVVANALPHIRSGAVRALAVTTSRRLDALPNVSTVAETIPGYEALVFTGVGVRAGTPDNVVAQLNRAINAGLSDSNIQKRLAELILTPIVLTPAEAGVHMRAEVEKWANVIRSANIKAE
jgi:tripartite-type tricarboxylate transporter receptor subunit TctC